jgi:hypothetical protein
MKTLSLAVLVLSLGLPAVALAAPVLTPKAPTGITPACVDAAGFDCQAAVPVRFRLK